MWCCAYAPMVWSWQPQRLRKQAGWHTNEATAVVFAVLILFLRFLLCLFLESCSCPWCSCCCSSIFSVCLVVGFAFSGCPSSSCTSCSSYSAGCFCVFVVPRCTQMFESCCWCGCRLARAKKQRSKKKSRRNAENQKAEGRTTEQWRSKEAKKQHSRAAKKQKAQQQKEKRSKQNITCNETRNGCRLFWDLLFFGCICFFSLGHFSLLLATFWSKTCTLLNFGAKICHLHCSSIVEAQMCCVWIVALDAIIGLVSLGFI